MISIIASSAPGLSPLARGTLTAWYAESHPERFIPAGAGNTTPATCFASRSAVYPRWRGEHKARNFYSALDPGLSPLARGTQCGRFRGIVRRRFIPAGAGNTSSDAKSGAAKSVYPRWRGEHSLLIAFSISDCGLSPLARGTQNPPGLHVKITRFIPAGAGNTLSIHNCF